MSDRFNQAGAVGQVIMPDVPPVTEGIKDLETEYMNINMLNKMPAKAPYKRVGPIGRGSKVQTKGIGKQGISCLKLFYFIIEWYIKK